MNPFVSTVDFCSSLEEREMYETMADLFSIFLATESLEKSYIRDVIPSDEYNHILIVDILPRAAS